MEKVVIYPGTFDPITEGHLDIIEAGLKLFDKVVIGILTNPEKIHMFNFITRLEFIQNSLSDRNLEVDKIEIGSSNKLTADFVKEYSNVVGILRGLRLNIDYEYELILAFNNIKLNANIQTILIPPKQEHIHISSTVVRQLVQFEQYDRLDGYVTKTVRDYIMANFPPGKSVL